LLEPSLCGRTNQRIKGWLGRADQSAKVRGMFVHPLQIGEIIRRHPAVRRARLVIERPASADVMTLMVETEAPVDADAIAATAQSVTKLRTTVSCVAPGSLPEDGKLIEDRRPIG
jgi:phenylacetate-CoA ligase